MTETEIKPAVVAPLIAATCATFVAIGVARFAYAPLLPEMVESGWLGAGAAGLLGAANLAGYLAGALLAPAIGRRFGAVAILRCAMLLTALSMVPCAYSGGFLWFLPWRVLAGVTAGVLMALAGPTVQAVLPTRVRGLAGGFLFGGVGGGSVAGALIVPALLTYGLPATWLALAVLCFAFTALAWRLWPTEIPPPAPRPAAGEHWPPGALALVGCYALCGIAAAPHMQWWPDYLARGLGQGTAAGAHSWLIWGISAACAPLMFGRLADRIGGRLALLVALTAQAAALLIPLLDHTATSLFLSVMLAGATAAGLSALVLTRSREVAGPQAGRLWSMCTSSYGASQTFAGFFLAWLYTTGFGHLPLFATGLIAIAVAFLLVRR